MRTITVIAGLLLLVSHGALGQVQRQRMCFDEVVRHLSSVRDTMYIEERRFKVTWNGTRLHIPSSAYANLYEFNLTSIEAYISHKTGCMYVYVSASDGAGAYSVKFVFSRKGFVTRLISTNECTDGFDCIDAIPTTCDE